MSVIVSAYHVPQEGGDFRFEHLLFLSFFADLFLFLLFLFFALLLSLESHFNSLLSELNSLFLSGALGTGGMKFIDATVLEIHIQDFQLDHGFVLLRDLLLDGVAGGLFLLGGLQLFALLVPLDFDILLTGNGALQNDTASPLLLHAHGLAGLAGFLLGGLGGRGLAGGDLDVQHQVGVDLALLVRHQALVHPGHVGAGLFDFQPALELFLLGLLVIDLHLAGCFDLGLLEEPLAVADLDRLVADDQLDELAVLERRDLGLFGERGGLAGGGGLRLVGRLRLDVQVELGLELADVVLDDALVVAAVAPVRVLDLQGHVVVDGLAGLEDLLVLGRVLDEVASLEPLHGGVGLRLDLELEGDQGALLVGDDLGLLEEGGWNALLTRCFLALLS